MVARARSQPATTAVLLIALCAAVAVASFLKSDLTRNDFERFDDAWLLVLFLALFTALSATYVHAFRQRQAIAGSVVITTGLACVVLMIATFPVGSRDLFVYAFYGKMWRVYGANPYLFSVAEVGADPWQPYVQVPWSHWRMIYGPLFLWQCRLVDLIAGDHMWVAVWTHKILAALALIALWRVATPMVAASDSSRGAGAAMLPLLVWNPLLLFEAAGNGHNDVIMALLVAGALRCWQLRSFGAALALLAVSFWYKWYPVLFLPAFLIESWKSGGGRRVLKHIILIAALGVGLGALVLAPIPGSLPVIVAELLAPKQLSDIYPTELSPLLAPWFWILRASGAFEGGLGAPLFHGGRLLLFAGACLAVLIRQWRLPPSPSGLVESVCLLALAFALLLITILWPWHLLIPITLGILSGHRVLLVVAAGITAVGLLSYMLTFAVAALGLGLVALALVLLRGRGAGAACASPQG
jgi:hypothetical protein